MDSFSFSTGEFPESFLRISTSSEASSSGSLSSIASSTEIISSTSVVSMTSVILSDALAMPMASNETRIIEIIIKV